MPILFNLVTFSSLCPISLFLVIIFIMYWNVFFKIKLSCFNLHISQITPSLLVAFSFQLVTQRNSVLPGFQRHWPRSHFLINSALKLCPVCGQSGSENHVRSIWVFCMLPWYISILGWPRLSIPTFFSLFKSIKVLAGREEWLNQCRQGRVDWKHQPLHGPLWGDYLCHLPWRMDGSLHFANPAGITEMYFGKKSPWDEEARQSLWYPVKRQSMLNKHAKPVFHPPNNPVFLFSLQVLYLVSEKWCLVTVSEDRRLWGLGSLRRKEKQPWSSVAKQRQDWEGMYVLT